jgi:hypothetical protein
MEVLTDELWQLGFKEIKTSKGWSRIHQDKNSTVYSKTLFPKSDVSTFKVILPEVSYSHQFILKMFKDIESSKEYTKYILESKKIQEYQKFKLKILEMIQKILFIKSQKLQFHSFQKETW